MGTIVPDAFGALLDIFDGLLPGSPFSNLSLDPNVELGLGWLNWFVPFDSMVYLMGVWIGATFLAVVIRAFMRDSGFFVRLVMGSGE